MTDDPSGDVGKQNGLRGRSRSLCLTLALHWSRLAARRTSWSTRSLRYLSAAPGAIHRRLRNWEAALKSLVHDCLASERAARLVGLFKKIESRYPWRCWVRQTGHCCRTARKLIGAQFRAWIGWLQNWTAGNRVLDSLRSQCIGLGGWIGRRERMKWAPSAYRRLRRWYGCLATDAKALTEAWPSTTEITGETAGAAPAEKRLQKPGSWADSESPLGYTGLVRPGMDRAVYSSAGRNASWGNGLWIDWDCPIGYARIAAEYIPIAEPESGEPELPESEELEVTEFQPAHFLLDLFRAYSQLLEQRGDGSPRLAPVVPLIDVFALLSSVRSLSPGYSSFYTKEAFIKDVYRLHASGVDTTLDGARISFPISRGVKGKTLTVTDEAGDERRYYGVRFLGQGSSG